MNFENFDLLRYLVLISVVIYFVFDHFEQKHIKDEREELIRLKTFELMQKLTMWSLTIIAVFFVFFPSMHAIYPVMILVVSSMYGEIFGKIYYRKRF